MGTKRDIVASSMENGEILKENIHPERRDNTKDVRAVKERRNKKNRKVPVWIKKEVLDYEQELRTLQIELLKLQNHVKEKGLKLLMIFEGRDAAGKGGTIKRITEHLNPRGARVVALDKPSDIEKTQWYFQRYTYHLPSANEIVLFDRSWYNRGGVELVMGFCTQDEHKEFLHEVSEYERMLVNSGTILLKFYFVISKKEQARRFEKRKTDPLKQYKLSPVDEQSQKMWDRYTIAKYSMLLASHTDFAPWTVIRADNKKRARINCIKHILAKTDYPNKIKMAKIETDPDILISGTQEINNMESHMSLKKDGASQ